MIVVHGETLWSPAPQPMDDDDDDDDDDPCLTFDSTNVLCSTQGFFQSNLVAIWHPKQFDLWLTPADPCMTFDPSNALHSDQGGSSDQIWWPEGIFKADWPLDDL